MITLRLALSQLNMRIGDYPGNSRKILDALKIADEQNADIVVFPELTLCGYPPEDLLHRKKFIQDGIKALKALAPQVKNRIALIGFADADKQGIYNAAAIIQNGKWIGTYRKILLPNYSVFDEKRYFLAGNEACILDCGQGKIGITICEDTWLAAGPVNTLLDADAGLLINLSASPYYRDKLKVREKMHSVLSRGSGTAVAYCNQVGGQDELVFDGGSFILNTKGKLQARAAQFTEEVLVADVEIGQGRGKELGQPDFPVKTIPVKLLLKEKAACDVRVAPDLAPAEEVFQALVLGIRDYAVKNGFSQAILGLSGGVDSALVAALAAEALGPHNVMAISMPTVFSSDGTKTDARLLAERMSITFREISIQTLFEDFKKVLEPDFKGLPENVAEENLQARLRANILMTYSNKFGRLLLSTGNKSEASVGYCTMYGDMAGGFAPIKDIPKDLVYDLVNYYNGKKGTDIIPQRIIDREPSAELRPDQRDTDSLPPYPVLDKILYYHIEQHLDADEIARKGFSKSMVRDVIAKVRGSEYKRRQAPPGVKITQLAFGKDRRMPITNFFVG